MENTATLQTQKKFILLRRGGSIGEQSKFNYRLGGTEIREFSSKEEAEATKKLWNSRLSQGEKKYYGIKYFVRQSN